jgi:hypothetical protein
MRHLPCALNCLASASILVAGCSSDAVQPPEVRVENPGAFVATASEGQFGLFRSLGTVSYFGETFVVMIVYDVHPSSWDDAREMAKRSDLPLPKHVRYETESRLPLHQSVWFRTLTNSERAVQFQ